MAAIEKLVSSIVDRVRVYTGLIQAHLGKYSALSTHTKEDYKKGFKPLYNLDLDILNCRVTLENPNRDSSRDFFFKVQICGSIYNCADQGRTTASVSIMDITDGIKNSQPVHSRSKKWQSKNNPVFVYNTSIGSLSEGNNLLSEWVTVAKVYCDWLDFPRRGIRDLQFQVLILSGDEAQLAYTDDIVTCEVRIFGYNDLKQNTEQAKSLSIALAFAVSAVDNKLYHCEIETVKSWARQNINIPKESGRQFERALDNTVKFFQKGHGLDIHKVCKEIVNITPLSERYEILDLCLRVVQANGRASAEETDLLEKLARWLEVNMNKFRQMMEKTLPVAMHEVENIETILGVTSDMDRDKALQHLNNEYRKWNARVANIEPEIQQQAEQMLDLISRARVAVLREAQKGRI